MNELTRREFLSLAGITVVGTSLSGVITPQRPVAHPGRILEPAPVFAQPSMPSQRLQTLWPDTIVTIYQRQAEWYRIASGYVARDAVQPMEEPLAPPPPAPELPFWAEVSAPSVSVRAWCAPDAPLITRIGYGGTAHIIDHLPGWYRVQTGTQPLGWSRADAWRAAAPKRQATEDLHIVIADQCLSVFNPAERILYTPISMGTPLERGRYRLDAANPSGDFWPYHGASWLMTAGSITLAGVYWHNRFGEPVPGPTLQLPPLMARWLYRHSGPGTVLEIH